MQKRAGQNAPETAKHCHNVRWRDCCLKQTSSLRKPQIHVGLFWGVVPGVRGGKADAQVYGVSGLCHVVCESTRLQGRATGSRRRQVCSDLSHTLAGLLCLLLLIWNF